MPATRLILVRHAETIANRSYRHIGTSDEPLSEHGIEQARQLAEALAVLPIQAIYSSPLQRAYYTALPIAEQLALDVRPLDTLREGSFGAWEGLTHAEILARSEEDARLLHSWEQDATLAPPGGESLVAIQQRTSAAVEQLAHQHSGQTIALISHVGPIKAVLCTALGAPPISAFRIFLDPATISVIDWHGSQHAIVRLVNSHIHQGWASARWIQRYSA